jgi:hypothetical protein
MTRNGKIARLPLAIREELNQRLQNGEQGKLLVDWLNGLPEVQAVLRADFHAQPIAENNLSVWKTGGFTAWERDQETREALTSLMESAHSLQQTAKDGLIDRMGLILAAKMAVELRHMDSFPDGAEKAKLWRELRTSLLTLRRADLYAEKLRLDREKHAQRLRQQRAQERVRRQESQQDMMTPEEKEERIRQILGTD